MPVELFMALCVYSFVSSITPGPNNLMLLASGVNYGFRPTIPHMLGIAIGFGILLLCVGAGLGQLLISAPTAFTMVKFAGAAYLIFLAWKIANSGPIEAREASGKPMTFIQAAAFQWVNPKAWVMAVSAMAIYTLEDRYWFSVLLVAFVFVIINLPCVSVWCAMGTGLRKWLSDPKTLRLFNYTMAILLVASLWPMLK
ncbi:MAG: LysE family translocator [Rhizobiaceae bacterium]